MNFYISDLHLDHENIIHSDNRPFGSAKEMDAFIIEQWNKKVSPKDDVYIVGDISMKITPEVEMCLRVLNGTKHLVAGNHDRMGKNGFKRYIEDIYSIKEIKDNGRRVIMCHYPMVTWNAQRYGSIHLYGHVHRMRELPTLNLDKLKNAYNVFCGYYNYTPMTLEELIDIWGYDPDFYRDMPNGGC